VPVAHRIDGAAAAIRAQLHAGMLFALAALGIFTAGALPPPWASALLLTSVAVYSIGEIMQAAAAWELSFELAAPDRPGEYQAVFASGANIGPILAPFLITFVLAGIGDGGWLVLGIGLCAVAAAHLPLRPRRARLTGPREVPESLRA
jgi:MFS family permease